MDRLPNRQKLLFELLAAQPDADVEIRVIYGHVYGSQNAADSMAQRPGGVRFMQQGLGPVVRRLNERFAQETGCKSGWRISPGKTKQTYRLDTSGG